MNLKLFKRRAEMLDAVSTGLHPSAVVGQLAEKYGVSERTLWSDWERREEWVPFLLKLEKSGSFAEIIEQKLNAVQKAAWSIYLHATGKQQTSTTKPKTYSSSKNSSATPASTTPYYTYK